MDFDRFMLFAREYANSYTYHDDGHWRGIAHGHAWHEDFPRSTGVAVAFGSYGGREIASGLVDSEKFQLKQYRNINLSLLISFRHRFDILPEGTPH